jgi:hypothetical protein
MNEIDFGFYDGLDSIDAILSVTITGIPIAFDLSISTPQITQSGSSISPTTGLLQVAPGVPATVAVTVNGSGLTSSNSSGTTVVTITDDLGNTLGTSSPIALSNFVGTQSTSVPVQIPVTFLTSEIGTRTITATVAPVQGESNTANNSQSVEVQVVSPYQLVATVNGAPADGQEFTLAPSILNRTTCSALWNAPSSLGVIVQCLDTSQQPPVSVDGCSYQATFSQGAFNGGHDHVIVLKTLTLRHARRF